MPLLCGVEGSGLVGGLVVRAGLARRAQMRDSLVNTHRVPTDTLCNIRALENVRGFPVDGFRLGRCPLFVGNLTVAGVTTTVTGCRLNLLAGRRGSTVILTYRRVLGNRRRRRFPMSVVRKNTNASAGVGTGRIVTGHTLRVVKRGHNRCRCYSPGSRIGYSRSAGSTCPATVRVNVCCSRLHFLPCLRSLVNTFRGGKRRFTRVVGVKHARLRSTIPVALNRAFGNFTDVLESRVHRLGRTTTSFLAMGVNTATVNANVYTRPKCTRGYIGTLYRVANFSFGLSSSLMKTASSASYLMNCTSTLGEVTMGMGGVYGSLHLLTDKPHYNLKRFGLPTVRPKSSVVPNGIGPIVPRIVGRVYCGMVNGRLYIAVTNRTTRVRLGTVRPIVTRYYFRSMSLVVGNFRALHAHYMRNVATGTRHYGVRIRGDVNMMATLGPVVNCGGSAGVTGRTLRANEDICRLILRRNVLGGRRLSAVLDPRGVLGPMGLSVGPEEWVCFAASCEGMGGLFRRTNFGVYGTNSVDNNADFVSTSGLVSEGPM